MPPPPPPPEEDVDSNVITLPTLEVIFSSPMVEVGGNPDNPVMDDAALGTVESISLFVPFPMVPPTPMGTNVAGGVLLVSAPNELSNEDIGSTSRLAAAELSLDNDRVGGGGEDTDVDTGTLVAGCALMDGTCAVELALFDSAGVGTNDVGTNSLAVARIIPIGFVSTGGCSVSPLIPGWNPGGPDIPPPLPT